MATKSRENLLTLHKQWNIISITFGKRKIQLAPIAPFERSSLEDQRNQLQHQLDLERVCILSKKEKEKPICLKPIPVPVAEILLGPRGYYTLWGPYNSS